MRPFLALCIKETRQNALLFLIPSAILLLLVAAASAGFLALGDNPRGILALAVPVALAVALGLQAFDLEENHQTRDFLLTKPISFRGIFAAKFISGLAMLIVSVLLWIGILTPDAVQAPSFADYSTFWFTACLFLLTAVYGACVTAGVFVKGPLKVLCGALLGALAAAWFFTGFFAIMTVILYLKGAAGPCWAWSAVATGSALLGFLLACLAGGARWHLANTTLPAIRGELLLRALALCLLPMLALGAVSLAQPAIRPFNSLFATFLGREQWFAAIAGARQPGGDLYALADAHGRLGLGRRGQKPLVIHEAPDGGEPLAGLAWSPDGRRITFRHDGLIYLYELEAKKAIPAIYGEAALWSTDPGKMLVLAAGDDREGYGLYLADLDSRTASLQGTMAAIGLDLAWDSDESRLLALERGWILRLIGLKTGEVKTIDLTPYPGCIEAVFAGRFFPPAAGGGRRLAVFAADPAAGKERLFNVYFYELDSRMNLKRAGMLRRVFFEELMDDPAGGEVLGLIGAGVYRAIHLPEEVS